MRSRAVWAGLLLAAIGAAAYHSSLPGALFWDDEVTVVNNVFIRSPAYLNDIFTSSYHTGGGETLNFYRPLTTVSFMADYRLWGLNPLGFHLSSLLLHLLNGCLLWGLWRRLTGGGRASLQGGDVSPANAGGRVAWLAAALFLIHPINSEAVNYVSNRTDLLMLSWLLASFHAYVRFRTTGRRRWLAAAVLGYAASILSKEMGLVLPLLALAYEATRHDERRGVARRLPAVLAFLPVLAGYVACRMTVLNFMHLDLLREGAQPGPFSEDPLIRLLTFANAALVYLRVLLVPGNLHMEYDNPIAASRLDGAAWASLSAVLLLAGTAAWLGRRDRRVWFALAWMVCGVLPISGVIPINNVLAEHYLYLASAGWFLFVALGTMAVWDRARSPRARLVLASAGLAVSAAWGSRTIERNRDWQDPLGMYLDIASHSRTSFRANNNAGVEYFRRGSFDEAEAYFRRAIAIHPAYGVALNNLGALAERRGNLQAAEWYFSKALASGPETALPRKNLIRLYQRQGRFHEAAAAVEELRARFPHDPDLQSLAAPLRRGGGGRASLRGGDVSPADAGGR